MPASGPRHPAAARAAASDPVSGQEPGRPAWLGPLLKLLVGIGIAAFFLRRFFASADLAGMLGAVKRADPYLLFAALAAAVFGFVVRGWRWRCYLKPVRDVPARPVFEILMIGYMVSNFIPGRPGDLVVRPLLMRRSQGIPAAATLATIAVERLFDTVTVVLAFAVYLAFFAPQNLGGLDLTAASYVGWVLLLGCAYGLRLIYGLRSHEARCLDLLGRLTAPLPARFRTRLLEQARSFSRGAALFEDRGNAALSVLHSILAWVAVGLFLWLVALALGLGIRPVDSLLLIGLGALGVAIPTPGGVGSFQFLMLEGLLALGVKDADAAAAAAMLMWAMSFVPMTVLGIWAWLRRARGGDGQEPAPAETAWAGETPDASDAPPEPLRHAEPDTRRAGGEAAP